MRMFLMGFCRFSAFARCARVKLCLSTVLAGLGRVKYLHGTNPLHVQVQSGVVKMQQELSVPLLKSCQTKSAV